MHLLTLLFFWIGSVLVVATGRGDDATLLQSRLDRLARRGEILVDHRPPPVPPHLRRRQVSNTDEPTPSSSAVSTTTEESSLTTTPSLPSSTSPPASETEDLPPTSTVTTDPEAESPSPLPRVFDTSLGSNFTTTSCPSFFQQFLGNNEFMACLPLSLLLQNSHSFFQASRSLVRITQALDATCDVDFNACSNVMSRFAQEIRRDTNCGLDFKNQNPLVVQAYNGMIAYQPLYRAGCLKSESGSYCYADAITNISSPSDSHVYFLALGLDLPGGSRPACTSCLQKTMQIFATAASNSSQPASRIYVNTAQLINRSCGPDYVNATIPPSANSARGLAADTSFARIAMLAVLISCAVTHWLA